VGRNELFGEENGGSKKRTKKLVGTRTRAWEAEEERKKDTRAKGKRQTLAKNPNTKKKTPVDATGRKEHEFLEITQK